MKRLFRDGFNAVAAFVLLSTSPFAVYASGYYVCPPNLAPFGGGVCPNGTLPQFQAGDPPGTRRSASVAKTDKAAEARKWLEYAGKFYDKKDYRKAITYLDRSLELDEGDGTAYWARGISHYRLKEYRPALSDLDAAVRVNPRDGNNYLGRALVYRELEDWGQYRQNLQAAADRGVPAAADLLQKMDSAGGRADQGANVASTDGGGASGTRTGTCSWTGTWKVNNDWGTFSVTQQGTSVSGRIIGGWAEGAIEGTVSDNQLHAAFQREGRTHVDGEIELTASADCRQFSGNWKWHESATYAASGLSGTRTSSKVSQQAATNPPPDKNKVVGSWYGVAGTVGEIDLNADGTYNYNGYPGGRYRVTGQGIDFSGNLAAWGGGHATLKGGNLEFFWSNPSGATNWFAFSR